MARASKADASTVSTGCVLGSDASKRDNDSIDLTCGRDTRIRRCCDALAPTPRPRYDPAMRVFPWPGAVTPATTPADALPLHFDCLLPDVPADCRELETALASSVHFLERSPRETATIVMTVRGVDPCGRGVDLRRALRRRRHCRSRLR
jgi:hypothetical protein